MFVVLTGTTGMLSGVAAATGEEIGWRGFLVPELAKALPFTGVALVSGLIWAASHYPITAVVYRRQPQPVDAIDLRTPDKRPGVHEVVAGDLGLAFVVVAAVVAVMFWLKRANLSAKQPVPQAV
jgi:membrane protease YdiL (CAAX protease family)